MDAQYILVPGHISVKRQKGRGHLPVNLFAIGGRRLLSSGAISEHPQQQQQTEEAEQEQPISLLRLHRPRLAAPERRGIRAPRSFSLHFSNLLLSTTAISAKLQETFCKFNSTILKLQRRENGSERWLQSLLEQRVTSSVREHAHYVIFENNK